MPAVLARFIFILAIISVFANKNMETFQYRKIIQLYKNGMKQIKILSV